MFKKEYAIKNNFSIIIPTMNRFYALKNTIESFSAHKDKTDVIIVIDQSNDRNSSENIKKYVHYKAGVIYNFQDSPSSTLARNIGMNIANGLLTVFSDDDIEINEKTLSNIAEIMSDESISMIAGINELEPKSKSTFGYLLGFKSFFKRKKGHLAPGIFGRFPNKMKGEVDTEWAMGFFFVVRKSLVEKWGLKWDEKLTSYAYAEDLDFSYSYYKKSKEEGYRCIMSDKVVVKHLQSQEYRIPSRKATFMYVLHRAYLYKKHNLSYKYWIGFKVCNFVMYIKRKLKKENPQDMKDAMRYLKKHKKEVFEGKFYYGD